MEQELKRYGARTKEVGVQGRDCYHFRFRFIPLLYFPYTSLVFSLYLFSIFFIPLSTHAYFQSWGDSARMMGRGGTGAALTGSLEGLLGNPAGLGFLPGVHVNAEYAAFPHGFTDGSSLAEQSVRAGWPFLGASVGLSWQSRGLASLFQEDSWGVSLASPAPWSDHDVIGVTVKWLRLVQQPVFWTSANAGVSALQAQAFSADVGVILALTPDWAWGIVVQDITQPVLSLVGEEARQPLAVRMGVRFTQPRWVLSCDPGWRGGQWDLAVGLEHTWEDLPFTLRYGTALAWPSGGSVQVTRATVGAGYQWELAAGRLALDYAFLYPMNGGSLAWATHRMSVGFYERGAIPSAAARTASFATRLTLPLPRVPFYTLDTPEEEWRALSNPSPQPSPLVGEGGQEQHRRAVLTALSAGTTAGEQAYQSLMGDRPGPYDALALKVMEHLRYGGEEAHSAEGASSATKAGSPVRRLARAYKETIQAGQEKADLWLTLGFLLAHLEEWPSALEAYQKWRALSGTEQLPIGGLYGLAVAALSTSNVAAAESQLAGLLIEAPNHPWIIELRGRMFMAQGRPEDGLKQFQDLETLYPSSVGIIRAKRHQVVALAALRRYPEAGAVVDDALRKTLEDEAIEYYLREGEEAANQLKLKEARTAFQDALKLIPGHPAATERLTRLNERVTEQVNAHRSRAQERMKEHDPEKALLEWQLVLDADPSQVEAVGEIDQLFPVVLLKAQDQLAKGRYAETMLTFNALEKIRPRDKRLQEARQAFHEAFAKQAEEAEKTLQDYPKAKAVWQAYLQHVPRDAMAEAEIARLTREGAATASTLFAQAKASQASDLQAALLLLRQALKSDPSFQPAIELEKRLTQEKAQAIQKAFKEGVDASAAGQDVRAVEAFRRVLKLDPEHPEVPARIKDLQGRQSGRAAGFYQKAKSSEEALNPADALDHLDQLAKVAPDHAEGKALRALIRQRLELATASRADAIALDRRGDKLYGVGSLAEAIAAWRDALKLDYYNKNLRRKIEDAQKENK